MNKQELARQALVKTVKENPKLSMNACWNKTRKDNPKLFDNEALGELERERGGDYYKDMQPSPAQSPYASLDFQSLLAKKVEAEAEVVCTGGFFNPLS